MSRRHDAKALQNLRSGIPRTVINYQQIKLGKKLSRLRNDTADGCLFVVGRNRDEHLLVGCFGHCSSGAACVSKVCSINLVALGFRAGSRSDVRSLLKESIRERCDLPLRCCPPGRTKLAGLPRSEAGSTRPDVARKSDGLDWPGLEPLTLSSP